MKYIYFFPLQVNKYFVLGINTFQKIQAHDLQWQHMLLVTDKLKVAIGINSSDYNYIIVIIPCFFFRLKKN